MVLVSLIFPFLLLVLVLILDRVERRFFPQEQQSQQLAAVDTMADVDDVPAESLAEQSRAEAALAEEPATTPGEEIRQQALFSLGESTVWLSRPARTSRRTPKLRSVRRPGRTGGRKELPWRHAA